MKKNNASIANNKKNSTLFYILFFIMCIACFCVHANKVFELKFPVIYMDEIAYLGHAANLSGLDWFGLLNYEGAAGYSWGWSLLLMPFFWLTHDISVIYKIAIGMNALSSTIAFMILYKISNLVFEKERNDYFLLIVSFCAALYSSTITYSHTSLCESSLYLLVSLSVLFLLLYEKNEKIVYFILFFAICVISYVVHKRAIILGIAGIIVLLLKVLGKMKKNKRWILISIIILSFILAIGVIFLMRDKLNNMLDSENINSLGYRLNYMIKKLFDTSLYIKILKSFAYKVWYLGVSSFFTVYWAIIFIVRQVIAGIKKQYIELTLIYCFLILCGMVFITAISAYDISYTTSGVIRIDTLFYGRYVDCMLPIFIVLGLGYLRLQGKEGFIAPLVYAAFLFVGYKLNEQVSELGNFIAISFQVVGANLGRTVAPMILPSQSYIDKLTYTTIIISLILLFAFLLYRLKKKKIVPILGIIMCCGLFFSIGNYSVKNSFIPSQENLINLYSEFSEIKEYVDANVQSQYLYAYNTKRAKDWAILQFNEWDTSIKIVNNLEEMDNSDILIMNYDDYHNINEGMNRFQIVYSTETQVVLQYQ